MCVTPAAPVCWSNCLLHSFMQLIKWKPREDVSLTIFEKWVVERNPCWEDHWKKYQHIQLWIPAHNHHFVTLSCASHWAQNQRGFEDDEIMAHLSSSAWKPTDFVDFFFKSLYCTGCVWSRSLLTIRSTVQHVFWSVVRMSGETYIEN